MNVHPLRQGVPSGRDLVLPVLVSVVPPLPEATTRRADIDLSLVIDRSGSMSGAPLQAAKTAAKAAVASLRETDRVAVVTFESRVSVVAPLQYLKEKTPLLTLIDTIEVAGSTALYDGWRVGAAQLSTPSENRMRRVILLTDGGANVGLQSPDEICNMVAKASSLEVLTTTMGFGLGYNETLMRAMAASGRGNHYYVERAGQLVDFFNLELSGLEATVGTNVRLAVRPGRQSISVRMLQELKEGPEGWEVADLMAGCPVNLLLMLGIPRLAREDEGTDLTVAEFELSWLDPREGARCNETVRLQLPVMTDAEWQQLEAHPQVVESLAVFDVSSAQLQAQKSLSLGNAQEAIQGLEKALQNLNQLTQSQQTRHLGKQLEDQIRDLKQGGYNQASKKMSASYHGSFSSVSLSGLRKPLARWRQFQQLQLPFEMRGLGQLGALVPQAAARPLSPERDRVLGLLLGGLFGESLALSASRIGPNSRLALEVLSTLTLSAEFEVGTVVQTLEQSQVDPNSQALRELRETLKRGESWSSHPADSLGSGALVRLAPLLLPCFAQPGVEVLDGALYTAITHRTGPALVGSSAFAHLWMKLLSWNSRPPENWWWTTFLETTRALDVSGQQHPGRAGFRGNLTEYLETLQVEAQDLAPNEACLRWGHGPYLLETIPCTLQLLAQHPTDPALAIENAHRQAPGNPMIAALVGTTLGALYGLSAFPADWQAGRPFVAEDEWQVIRAGLDQALQAFV